MEDACYKDNVNHIMIKLVDCRGKKCPLPIIQTRLVLNSSAIGDELVIYADDPAFSSDFQQFCFLADISLISKETIDTYQKYVVRVLK